MSSFKILNKTLPKSTDVAKLAEEIVGFVEEIRRERRRGGEDGPPQRDAGGGRGPGEIPGSRAARSPPGGRSSAAACSTMAPGPPRPVAAARRSQGLGPAGLGGAVAQRPRGSAH